MKTCPLEFAYIILNLHTQPCACTKKNCRRCSKEEVSEDFFLFKGPHHLLTSYLETIKSYGPMSESLNITHFIYQESNYQGLKMKANNRELYKEHKY